MSRDVSASPKSNDGIISNCHGDGVNVEVVDEDLTNLGNNQLSFSATLSTSFVSSEEIEESSDDLTNLKDKKKQRKNTEEIQRKRKDTTNSLSSFFHRFTRSEKEEKKIVEEEDEEIERPDKLASPESEEFWFESSSISGDAGALLGHEGDAEVYEWDPNTMNETLVLAPSDQQPTNTLFEEKGMFKLLEKFRNGEMRWLDDPQIKAMCNVKEAHEDITNMRLKVHEIEKEKRRRQVFRFNSTDESDDEQENIMIEKLFNQMNLKMINMHSALDTVPFYDANRCENQNNDDEYYSS